MEYAERLILELNIEEDTRKEKILDTIGFIRGYLGILCVWGIYMCNLWN